MRIITVFKQSSVFQECHVERLSQQVKRYSGLDLECIRDSEYSHWFIKMDVFSERGPVFHLDLDTTIIDDITPILDEVEKHDFITLEDFNRPGRQAGGICGWKDSMKDVYDAFAKHPLKGGSQQEFVERTYKGEVTFFQRVLPNMLQSYKVNIRRNSIHPDCRVVVFHGNPRPWAIPELVKE